MDMKHIVGLKDLRENIAKYTKKVQAGHSFIVMKHSKPLFKITPLEENEQWEEVIDFTRIKPGGVDIQDIK